MRTVRGGATTASTRNINDSIDNQGLSQTLVQIWAAEFIGSGHV